MLTLSEAVKSGRLQEFIAQEEARGVSTVSKADFDRLIALRGHDTITGT
jgi:hypothetical protein